MKRGPSESLLLWTSVSAALAVVGGICATRSDAVVGGCVIMGLACSSLGYALRESRLRDIVFAPREDQIEELKALHLASGARLRELEECKGNLHEVGTGSRVHLTKEFSGRKI